MMIRRRDSQVRAGRKADEEDAANDAALLALAEAFVAVRAYGEALGTCNTEASLDVALMLLRSIEESPALCAGITNAFGLRKIAEKLKRWADEVELREDVRRTLDALPTFQA